MARPYVACSFFKGHEPLHISCMLVQHAADVEYLCIITHRLQQTTSRYEVPMLARTFYHDVWDPPCNKTICPGWSRPRCCCGFDLPCLGCGRAGDDHVLEKYRWRCCPAAGERRQQRFQVRSERIIDPRIQDSRWSSSFRWCRQGRENSTAFRPDDVWMMTDMGA